MKTRPGQRLAFLLIVVLGVQALSGCGILGTPFRVAGGLMRAGTNLAKAPFQDRRTPQEKREDELREQMLAQQQEMEQRAAEEEALRQQQMAANPAARENTSDSGLSITAYAVE